MKLSQTIAGIALASLALGFTPARARDRAFEEKLAEAYAPVLYQDVDDSKHAGAPDLPTRYDFDGNKVGDDNWQNFDKVAKGEQRGDRRAFLYYDVIETDTHYFISYSVFHAQDWDDSKWKGFRELAHRWSEHENDLEPILVVVEKTKNPLGRLVLLETEAHNTVHVYGDARDLAAGTKQLEGPIRAEGRHPKVFVQAKGHGIYGADKTLETGEFPGGDGFILHVGAPEDAYDPTAKKDRNAKNVPDRTVGYGLLSTHDELWSAAQGPAFGKGQTTSNADSYRGSRFRSDRRIGFSFSGNDGKPNAANLPWGQVDPHDGTTRGDWFLDPAFAVSQHFHFTAPFSTDYVWNPYFDELGITGARSKNAKPDAKPDEAAAVKAAVRAVCRGISAALGE